jgi:putative endonuclease
MLSKSEIGKLGEDLACKYLIKKGYKVIERNYRKPWGELDIIAIDPDKTLIFVEVKTIRNNDVDNLLISPENQLTSVKLTKLQKMAILYVNNLTEQINTDNNWQIDLLALTIVGKNCHIKHYKNI